MSVLEYIVKIIPMILSFLGNLLKLVIKQVRIISFRIRNIIPPLSELEAKQIARAILGGTIEIAIAYRNLADSHIYIPVKRRSSEEDYDYQVYILEQIGNTFRPIWNSERLYSSTSEIYVKDIDGDGVNEVIFTDRSYGTGAGSEYLFVYSTSKRQLFQITEFYNWQDAAGPISPQIEIRPETEGQFRNALERYAAKLGFFQRYQVDFNKPEFAVQRWHAENGSKRTGSVKLHFYNGSPNLYEASIIQEIDIGNIIWITYFKGPVFGYIKSKNQHFIAYSPSWIYNWATCLVYYEEKLWFGIHLDPGLLSFEFHQDNGFLNYYTHYHGGELPYINKIICYNGKIILNDEINIAIADLLRCKEEKKKFPKAKSRFDN